MKPNDEALARFARGDARTLSVVPAAESLPSLAGRRALSHAGPPLEYARMCGAMQGALCGAMLFEGWAATADEAVEELVAGRVRLYSNHEIGAVAPMAGVISPSMHTFVVENPSFGNRAVTIINEGILRETLRCGANSPVVIQRLRWLNEEVMPGIARAMPRISLRDIMTEAVLMGDELHQRNGAATSLFLRAVLRPLVAAGGADATIEYFVTTPQFFLNLAMASSKALLDPLGNIPGCTIVTAMSRNGVEFGIRVSGTGPTWFTAPAPRPAGVYWPPYGRSDANRDIGDSAIVETAGLGGFILPTAPGVHTAVGCGGMDEAQALQNQLRSIVAGKSPFFICSPAEALGSPFGIDVEKVVETRVTPAITTGIAHRVAGYGMIGAGIVRAPIACFDAASAAMRPASFTARG